MKKEESYDSVLVVGAVAYDEIMDFPGKFVDYLNPKKLHQINVSFVVDRLEKQLGGVATNIAYNLSLLTQKKIKILGAVGKDGEQFINFFWKNHIDTNNLIVDKKFYTSTGKAITDVSDNQIWGFYYGASRSAIKIKLKTVTNPRDLFVLSATHPAAFLRFQKDVIRLKMKYFYDPGMVLTWIKDEDLKEGVYNCRWLIGNDYEVGMILKRLRKTIKELTNDGLQIITTLGANGVIYQSKEESHKVKSYKVKKIVDPTGAGDAWRGGFLTGILDGRSILASLRIGNALASFAIEKYGTVNHHPTRKEVYKKAGLLL